MVLSKDEGYYVNEELTIYIMTKNVDQSIRKMNLINITGKRIYKRQQAKSMIGICSRCCRVKPSQVKQGVLDFLSIDVRLGL